ncbi:MAG: endonuclease [Chloroflexi bacterium]|nr:endonuclease [Chloroflexota bacterium]
MCVYLLHFSEPISPDHTAQHYLGSTEDLTRRLAEHRAGAGSRLCEVAKERGIDFVLVRTWQGDRGKERQLKRRKSGPKLCPLCNGNHSGQLSLFFDFSLADVEGLEF